MRVHVTVAHHLRVAKSLKKALAAKGVSRGLQEMQEVAAAMFGFGSAFELKKHSTEGSLSPWDEAVSSVERANRRSQYVGALAAAGIDHAIAEAVINEVKPTARRSHQDNDWMLLAPDGRLAVLSLWQGKMDAFRETKGCAWLQAELQSTVAGIMHWPEKGEARTFRNGAPDFLALLTSMRNQAHHPMWASSIVRVLAVIYDGEGAGAALLPSETPHAAKALASGDPSILSDYILRSKERDSIGFFLSFAHQMLPMLIAGCARAARISFPPAEGNAKPKKVKSLPIGAPDLRTWITPEGPAEWKSLSGGSMGDMESFCAWGMDLDLPDRMYFYPATTGAEKPLKRLRESSPRFDAAASKVEFGRLPAKNEIAETVVIGLEDPDGEQPLPCGLYSVRHMAMPRERRHVMSVDLIEVGNDRGREKAAAAVASICMGMTEVADEWIRVTPPHTTLGWEVEIGPTSVPVLQMLVSSIGMAEDMINERDDAVDVDVTVRVLGRTIPHREWD